MKPKLDLNVVRRWATQTISTGSTSLSNNLAKEFNVSRVTAAKALKQLVKDGWLDSTGGTRPLYRLGRNREVIRTYQLPNIDEHIIWDHDFRHNFELADNVAGIAHHGFTEMVNNANDHSNGTQLFILMRLREGILTIAILDDGVGIFEKITRALDLPDTRLAILELSKGKFTTDPANHSGEGIFFTSRMFDQFQIEANGLHYDHDIRDKHDWLLELGRPETGTLVYMAIPINSQRTTREIFDAYTGTDDYGFDKTIVPVRLARIGNENLVSRSQAKRLVARFEGFKTVLLDFTGVAEIGQAFADEIFRVFTNSHPRVELVETNTTPEVQKMIIRARTAGILSSLPAPSSD